MFKRNEWIKILSYTMAGVGIGVILGGALFVYAAFADFWNCFCSVLGSGDSLPEVNSFYTFLFVIVICTTIGLVIGLSIALKARSKRVQIETKERGIANHGEVLRQINDLLRSSDITTKQINQYIPPARSHAKEMRNEIVELLNKYERQRKETTDFVNQFKDE